MLAPLLALLSSISWGSADFLAGVKSRKLALVTVLLTTQAAGLLFIAAVVLVRGRAAPAGDFAVFAALSGLAGAAGIAFFYRGLAVGVMSIVAPISATAAVIPVAYGIAAGDSLSGAQIAGIALALVGVVLASVEAEERSLRHGRLTTGVAFALLAAVGFGSFYVAMDRAVGSHGDIYWAVLVNRTTSVALIVSAMLVLRAAPRFGAADAPSLLGIGALDISANLLYAASATRGLVSLVAVAGSLFPLTTIALAHIVLGERIARSQQVGVVAALAGVALISAG